MKKSQLIYQYIREQGAVSKQDIVIGLGLSLPTITQNLNNLAELGLIDTSKKISNTKFTPYLNGIVNIKYRGEKCDRLFLHRKSQICSRLVFKQASY